jgi:hypothetical protein
MLADTEEVALTFENTNLGSNNLIQTDRIRYYFNLKVKKFSLKKKFKVTTVFSLIKRSDFFFVLIRESFSKY